MDISRDLSEELNLIDLILAHNLVDLLDKIEGYGKQHIYMFKIGNSHLDLLRNEEYITSILNELGLSEIYNRFKTFLPSEEAELTSFTYNRDWLKIRWVSREEKLELVQESEEQDEELREFLIKKYLKRTLRATTLFQVSLLNGNAELFIPPRIKLRS